MILYCDDVSKLRATFTSSAVKPVWVTIIPRELITSPSLTVDPSIHEPIYKLIKIPPTILPGLQRPCEETVLKENNRKVFSVTFGWQSITKREQYDEFYDPNTNNENCGILPYTTMTWVFEWSENKPSCTARGTCGILNQISSKFSDLVRSCHGRSCWLLPQNTAY